MNEDLLPAQLFMRGCVWLVSTYPVPTVEAEGLRAVQFAVDEDGPFVPVFTSKERAEAFFQELPPDDGPDILAPFRLNDLRVLGRLLDQLAVIGHTHLAFDPESDRADRILIPQVTAALHRHYFGPPGSNN